MIYFYCSCANTDLTRNINIGFVASRASFVSKQNSEAKSNTKMAEQWHKKCITIWRYYSNNILSINIFGLTELYISLLFHNSCATVPAAKKQPVFNLGVNYLNTKLYQNLSSHFIVKHTKFCLYISVIPIDKRRVINSLYNFVLLM